MSVFVFPAPFIYREFVLDLPRQLRRGVGDDGHAQGIPSKGVDSSYFV
jgi:hypothetical protein